MLEKTPPVVGHALEGVRAGMDKTFWEDPRTAGPEGIVVSSAAFNDGGDIPKRFTEDGSKTSPSLEFSGAPVGAACVVLIVEDADSPTPEPFVHLLAQFDADDASFVEGAFVSPPAAHELVLGHNTMRGLGWLPPDPPTGHGPHRYLFQVFALDHNPGLKTGAEKHDFERAVRGHVIARGKMIGIYQRPG